MIVFINKGNVTNRLFCPIRQTLPFKTCFRLKIGFTLPHRLTFRELLGVIPAYME